jgi:hypothetical protein
MMKDIDPRSIKEALWKNSRLLPIKVHGYATGSQLIELFLIYTRIQIGFIIAPSKCSRFKFGVRVSLYKHGQPKCHLATS